jgi:hypothetical protein
MKNILVPLVLGTLAVSLPALTLTSPDVSPGKPLPPWAWGPDAGGENRSPALDWKVTEPGVRSLALVVVDENPVAESWIHWMAVDIPPTSKGTAQGQPSPGRELLNTFREPGWGGLTPPAGTGVHRYAFHLYALKVDHLNLDGEVSWDQFQKAVKGLVVAESLLVGTAQR